MATIECRYVYDQVELINAALRIEETEDDWYCDLGPYCPRCRLAEAKTALDDKYGIPTFLMEDALASLAHVLPKRRVSKSESDASLIKLRELFED